MNAMVVVVAACIISVMKRVNGWEGEEEENEEGERRRVFENIRITWLISSFLRSSSSPSRYGPSSWCRFE